MDAGPTRSTTIMSTTNTTRCIVEVKGSFGGTTGGWRPASTGTENQTGMSDEEASTFDDHLSAEGYCDHLIQTYCDDDDALAFRVRAVD
jgi:hypothetical protein